MLLRRAALLLALAAPGAAFAQDTANVDNFALGFAGMRDGVTISVDGSHTSDVAKTGPGSFELTNPTGPVTVTITEPEPCIYEANMEMGGQKFRSVTDVRKMTSSTYAELESPLPGLNQFQFQFEGDPSTVQFDSGGTLQNGAMNTQILTSVPLSDLEAAWNTLRTACPATAG